jgi:hypothetical protein
MVSNSLGATTIAGGRSLRFAVYLFISVAALSIGGIVALRVHAANVARQAERLQTEVLRLKPGVTTLEELRNFVSRSERPAGYAGFDGPVCNESECVASIGPSTFTQYWGNPVLQRLSVFGVRPADYSAIVWVGDGIVRRVIFGVYYVAAHDQTFDVTLTLVQRFSSSDLRSSSVSKAHPAFAVCGDALRTQNGIQIGQYLAVGIATDSTGERIRLNSACVTSLRGCSDPGELVQLETTSVPDLIQQGNPPRCPSENLAWSGDWWPRGTYPK